MASSGPLLFYAIFMAFSLEDSRGYFQQSILPPAEDKVAAKLAVTMTEDRDGALGAMPLSTARLGVLSAAAEGYVGADPTSARSRWSRSDSDDRPSRMSRSSLQHSPHPTR